MATLSRTKKYQDLRDRLQHDTSTDSLSTNDLSRFEKRLNEIDSQNFSYTQKNTSDSFAAGHARNHDIQKEPELLRRKKSEPTFDTSAFSTNENDVTFDNDYLDQYIREVKQYNIDQGNAASENTSLNILKQIERNNSKAPDRPYPRSTSQTTDIPFINEVKEEPKQQINQQPSTQEVQPTQVLSKEDIMAEVQNMVNGTSTPTPSTPVQTESPFVSDSFDFDKSMNTDTFNRRLEADRTTRQQLLNETTQMRAQLDDYEDNLSEVSDKMRQTNKILNLVLVLLIVFLAIIVGIVVYWIVVTK